MFLLIPIVAVGSIGLSKMIVGLPAPEDDPGWIAMYAEKERALRLGING